MSMVIHQGSMQTGFLSFHPAYSCGQHEIQNVVLKALDSINHLLSLQCDMNQAATAADRNAPEKT